MNNLYKEKKQKEILIDEIMTLYNKYNDEKIPNNLELNIEKFQQKNISFMDENSCGSRITSRIFLGDANCAQNLKWLKKNKITHIINAAKEVPNYFPSKFKYLNLNMEDSTDYIIEKLDRAIKFILEAIYESPLPNNNYIYIHCYAGISRSASVVAYYLIICRHMTLNQAIQFIKNKRPQIKPNSSYMLQLESITTN